MPVIFKDTGRAPLNMNMKEGLLTKKAIRQAVQAAPNANDMMLAAFSGERFFSMMPPSSRKAPSGTPKPASSVTGRRSGNGRQSP